MKQALTIKERIMSALPERSVRFVFPSSVAAVFWAEYAAEAIHDVGAVDLDRFMAWDAFKAAAMTADRGERTPADAVIRSLFAAALLAENAASARDGQPLLQEYIRPSYAANYAAYIGPLAKALPSLESLARRAETMPSEKAEDGSAETVKAVLADWLTIRERYGAFLDRYRLFEPAWERTAFQALGANWLLFFPELAEDWPEYSDELEKAANVEILPLDSLARDPGLVRVDSLGESGGLLRFTTGDEEISYAVETVRRLVDQEGLRPDDIVISAPNAAELAFHLSTAFRLRDITLDCRFGQALSERGVGRLFTALAACRDEKWSYRAIKNLLLDRAFPWRAALPIEALIDFGLKYRCVAGFEEDGRGVDVWLASLDRASARSTQNSFTEIRRFYSKLKRHISDLLTAADFHELTRRLMIFKTEFFDESAMEDEFDLLLSRAIEELNHLADSFDSLPGLAIGDPFSLFIHHLRSVPYVFQSREPGIRFYEYRVTAGIAPPVHLVLNATQEAVSVRADPFAFIREDLRPRLNGAERDLSAAFLDAYALSGASVVFTAAENSFAGPAQAHAKLLASLIGPVKPARAALDPWRYETALTLNRQSEIKEKAETLAPTAIQRQAKARSAVVDGERLDLRRRGLRDPVLRDAIRSVLTRGEANSVSPSDLNEHASCPFAWLLKRGLAISEKTTEIATVDQRELGELYHRVLERFFLRLQSEAPGRFRIDQMDRYRRFLAEETDAALKEKAENEGAFQESVYAMLRGRVLASVEAYVEEDAERLDAARVVAAEMWLSLPYPENGLVLEGRADAVLESNEGLSVIDFKTGKTPSSAYLLPDDTGVLADIQIAAYIRMLETTERKVFRARYYSLDYREAKLVIDPEKGKYKLPVSREAYGDALAAVDRAVADIAETLSSSLFAVPSPADRAAICGRCAVANVCRLVFSGEEL